MSESPTPPNQLLGDLVDLVAPPWPPARARAVESKRLPPAKETPASQVELSTETRTPSLFAEQMRAALIAQKVTPAKIAAVIKSGLVARFRPELLERRGRPDVKTRLMAARMAADMWGDDEAVVKKLTAKLPADKAAQLFAVIRRSAAERRAPSVAEGS